MTASDAFELAFRALTLKAWTANQARAAELSRLATEWSRTGSCPADQREHGRELAHSLRGSAGTFGHPEACIAAERLEESLESITDERVPEGAQALIDQIHAALTREPIDGS